MDGIIFESDNVREMADAMTRLMEDKTLRREMSEAAIRNANEHRIDKIGEQLEGIYRTAIDLKKSKRR